MSTVLWTTVAVALVLLALAAHEAAHALVLRKLGFRIVEAGLGIPLPPRIVLPASRRIPFRLSLSPWLVGAYVTPDPAQQGAIDALPYRDVAWYSGAGVIVNLVSGGAFLAVLDVVNGRWVAFAICLGVTAALCVARRCVAAYVLPFVGVPVMLWLGYSLVKSVGAPEGPVGVGALLVVSTPYQAILAGGMAVPLGVGILNTIPLYPFDGGRIMDAALSRLLGVRAASVFRVASSVLAGCLVAYSMLSDVVWLVR